LCEKNPGTTAALQTDSNGCFFRIFVAFDQAVRSYNSKAVSSFHVLDGGHSKTKRYDGHHMIFGGKDGNGRFVLQAYGWIPSEAVVANLCWWFIQIVKRAGFPLNNIPLFTDCGHLLNAAIVLEPIGIYLNLKNCLEHVLMNIYHNFKMSGKHNPVRSVVRHHLSAIQASQSPDRWIRNVQKFVGALPDKCALPVVLYMF
jgi:hypothetical protein